MKIQKATEPIWPAFIAMGADALIHYALPERLSVGPRWLLFAVILVLLVPITFTYRIGRHNVTRILTFVALGALTIALIGSLGLMVQGLPHHKDAPGALLEVGSSCFGQQMCWYSRCGTGSSTAEGRPAASLPTPKARFYFRRKCAPRCAPGWSPVFVDYLFLAFNTSTAFSPTDTAVLSRWAKGLMMIQSLISLS